MVLSGPQVRVLTVPVRTSPGAQATTQRGTGTQKAHGILPNEQVGDVNFWTEISGQARIALEDAERSFEEFPEAARILDERFREIFEDYEIRLREMRSLLVVGDGTTPEQLEANARSVLGRATKVLKGEERSLLAVEEEIYRNIESSDEPLNPHPDESFRAGVALCKAAVTVVVRNLLPGAPPEKIAAIALAVQEIVMDRVSRMVMASYVDYLLTKVKETQFEERRRYSRELHDRLAHQMTVVTQSLDLYGAYKESDAERAEVSLPLMREKGR